jgi:integrase
MAQPADSPNVYQVAIEQLRLRAPVHEANRRLNFSGCTVQELQGHSDVATTMVYAHVLNKGGRGVRSPLDGEATGGANGRA